MHHLLFGNLLAIWNLIFLFGPLSWTMAFRAGRTFSNWVTFGGWTFQLSRFSNFKNKSNACCVTRPTAPVCSADLHSIFLFCYYDGFPKKEEDPIVCLARLDWCFQLDWRQVFDFKDFPKTFQANCMNNFCFLTDSYLIARFWLPASDAIWMPLDAFIEQHWSWQLPNRFTQRLINLLFCSCSNELHGKSSKSSKSRNLILSKN